MTHRRLTVCHNWSHEAKSKWHEFSQLKMGHWVKDMILASNILKQYKKGFSTKWLYSQFVKLLIITLESLFACSWSGAKLHNVQKYSEREGHPINLQRQNSLNTEQGRWFPPLFPLLLQQRKSSGQEGVWSPTSSFLKKTHALTV